MSKSMVTIFNDHFNDFINDIQSVFPDDIDIMTAKNALITIRKTNPKLLVNIWMKHVYNPYKQQISDGDIQFFINKDYSSDVSKADSSDKIMEAIDRLRMPIKNMSPENQSKTMKYIQNLSKLAQMVQ
jgi:hypothetical protein